MLSAQQVRVTRRLKPDEVAGLSGAVTWTAASPATTCPTPRRIPPGDPGLCGRVKVTHRDGVRDGKSDVGLDEYETRTPNRVRSRFWAGWHHHIAMCLLGGAFLMGLHQDWGGCPGSHDRRSTGWCVGCCTGNGSGRLSCCGCWRIRSYATNARAAPIRDAAPLAVSPGRDRHLKLAYVVQGQ